MKKILRELLAIILKLRSKFSKTFLAQSALNDFLIILLVIVPTGVLSFPFFKLFHRHFSVGEDLRPGHDHQGLARRLSNSLDEARVGNVVPATSEIEELQVGKDGGDRVQELRGIGDSRQLVQVERPKIGKTFSRLRQLEGEVASQLVTAVKQNNNN